MFRITVPYLVCVLAIFLVGGLVFWWIKKCQLDKEASNISWGGLNPGDVMEYKGNKYLYRGINKKGGPGMAGVPEPEFMPPDPKSLYRYYLRPIGLLFPEKIFGENNKPVRFGNVLVGFLNDVDINKLREMKVGHITPKEWDKLCRQAYFRVR